MVEVTQEVREAAQTLFDTALGNMASYAEYGRPSYREGAMRDIEQALQAAFNAGRASVLAELESPTEAMALSGVAPFTFSKNDLQQVKAIFTAMIGAYKEAINGN